MSQVNSYKVLREGSQFGAPGTLVPLTENQAAAFIRTSEIAFEKPGEPPLPKGAGAVAQLRARVAQLEADLQTALAGSPDAAAVKAAQDAQAEAERQLAAVKADAAILQGAHDEGQRLLTASKEANALTESERDKALADLAAKETELVSTRAELEKSQALLAEAGVDLEKAASDYSELLQDRDALEASLASLGFVRSEDGAMIPPEPAPAGETAA